MDMQIVCVFVSLVHKTNNTEMTPFVSTEKIKNIIISLKMNIINKMTTIIITKKATAEKYVCLETRFQCTTRRTFSKYLLFHRVAVVHSEVHLIYNILKLMTTQKVKPNRIS